jgi:Uma2 family endonuclease
MTTTASPNRESVEVYDVTPELAEFLPRFLGLQPHGFESEPLVVPASRGNVTWEDYKSFLDATGDRLLRHSFMDGTLELMSPRVFERENTKAVLKRLVQALTLAMKRPVVTLGTTTLVSPRLRLGIEPDEGLCFVRRITPNSGLYFDVDRNGPPDLAIEVGQVRTGDSRARVDAVDVDRIVLLARLGVREVWFATCGKVRILRNLGKRLVAADRSQFHEAITGPLISRHLRSRFRVGENACIAEFVAEALT